MRPINIPREVMVEGETLLGQGTLSCQGCGASLAMKIALKALGERTIVVIPACCWSIINGVFPYSALNIPVLHIPFETAAVSASGVRAALDVKGEKDVVVMAWAGDGGTFDIGMQALSGAAERNEDILYVCYDNEAYMNTGIQRSSATPKGAWTTTTPSEDLKREPKKNIEGIMLSHRVPYIATASVAYPDDMFYKFKKVRSIKGTKFIHILSPCPPGWRIDPSNSIKITRMATLSKIFPLYEILHGECKVTLQPKRFISVKEYLRTQGRFKMMPDELIDSIQKEVDSKWENLLKGSYQCYTS